MDDLRGRTYQCALCPFTTKSLIKYSEHCQRVHNNRCFDDHENGGGDGADSNIEEQDIISRRHQKIDSKMWRVKAWTYKGGNDDLHTTLDHMKEKIKSSIISFIRENVSIPSVKFQITVVIDFAKLEDATTNEWITSKIYFNSSLKTLLDLNLNFTEAYASCVSHIWANVDRFIRNGSGWVFRRIQQVQLNLFRYQPFVGSSYIQTPRWVTNKKCVVNIKNRGDNQCFKWCILGYKYRNKVHGKSKFKSTIYNRQDWVNSLDWGGIQFPTSLSDIDIFEQNNPQWAVHVLQIDTSQQTIPVMVRKSEFFYFRQNRVVLLLIVDEVSGNQHYTLVTNYHKLCKTNYGNKSKVCLNCMRTFTIRTTKSGRRKDELRYYEHVELCIQPKVSSKITFPKNKKMKFKNIGHIKRNEFNITADFECLMGEPPESTEDDDGNVKNLDGVNILSTHKVFSVGMYVVSDRFQDQFKPQKYRVGKDGAKNAGYMFCKMLYENIKKINHLYESQCNKPMQALTSEEEKQFAEGNICHICDEEIKCTYSYNKWASLMRSKILTDDPTEEGKVYVDALILKGPKVKDHCRWTSKYRGIAHSLCNSLYRERGNTIKTSVFFHNGTRYDNHCVLQNLFKFMEENEHSFDNPKVIAKTLESFMQINLGKNTVIKDSMNFLGSSLDKLVKNLKDEGRQKGNMREVFKHTYSYFDDLRTKIPSLTEEDFDLLTRKNVYCYDYMTDLSKCDEPCLPPIDKFYSRLTGESISNDDYHHAKNVFERFLCKDLGDYTDLYVLTDTLLLSDVIEGFRTKTYNNFKLDPVYYTSTPSLSLDCALKYTKSEFDILDTEAKSNFVDESIIGGYSAAHSCYALSNNRLIPHKYDEKKKDSYIVYLDANNLYGCGLRGLLPYKDLILLTAEEAEKFNDEEFIKNLSDTSPEGYFIKCDVDYPEELHNNLAHITLPFLPEHIEIDGSMLSEYQRATSGDLSTKIGGKKVVTSFFNKRNINLHYVNLKQALAHGLKLRKVHSVMKFQQGYVLRKYVDLCTEMRKKSSNDFDKNFWKLCINSLFGKSCENLRKRRDIRIVSSTQDFMSYVRKPLFENGKVYDDHKFVGVELRKETICLDKPRYVGSAVLNLSKVIMYQFHHDYMMQEFPESELIFTDTDSLCYLVRSDRNVYDVLKKSSFMDFSNFPQTSSYYDDDLFLVPGKFKDECSGLPIIECIALRSKMYSMEIYKLGENTDNKKVAKGITRAYQKKYISHSDYKDCLETTNVKKCHQTNLTVRDHEIYTTEFSKNGLSAWNDKRLIYRDQSSKKFFCIPLGHYLSTMDLSDQSIIELLKPILPSDDKISKRENCSDNNISRKKRKHV